jgi:hypothetical protein
MTHVDQNEFRSLSPSPSPSPRPNRRKLSASCDSRSWLTVAAIAWILLASPCLRAQNAKPTDYDVKAAYLYNFAHFVDWPANGAASKSDSFTVCVLGPDHFGAILDGALAGETIAGKKVAARRISTPQDSINCQILFVSSEEDSRLKQIVETLNKQAVLTVSDMPRFSQRGGMIQFVAEGKRVRFEINLTAVQQAGLSLSSDLLKVAAAVRTSSSTGD